ncbi:hypothetical protein CLOP_g5117 [Closterium sp. NIES-67]|nr:hypothetical protein CLOP_g5117 [Closterium sp. NIES-67]
MFTIPSLRARDCSENEKTALNYLFLVVPLVNVTLPLVWKSFAAVWSADVIVFCTLLRLEAGVVHKEELRFGFIGQKTHVTALRRYRVTRTFVVTRRRPCLGSTSIPWESRQQQLTILGVASAQQL